MSGTIKQTFQMSVGNGGFADAVTINNLEVVQNNIGASSGVRTIGFAADEVIDTGDLATEGYVFIKNLEETGLPSLLLLQRCRTVRHRDCDIDRESSGPYWRLAVSSDAKKCSLTANSATGIVSSSGGEIVPVGGTKADDSIDVRFVEALLLQKIPPLRA